MCSIIALRIWFTCQQKTMKQPDIREGGSKQQRQSSFQRIPCLVLQIKNILRVQSRIAYFFRCVCELSKEAT